METNRFDKRLCRNKITACLRCPLSLSSFRRPTTIFIHISLSLRFFRIPSAFFRCSSSPTTYYDNISHSATLPRFLSSSNRESKVYVPNLMAQFTKKKNLAHYSIVVCSHFHNFFVLFFQATYCGRKHRNYRGRQRKHTAATSSHNAYTLSAIDTGSTSGSEMCARGNFRALFHKAYNVKKNGPNLRF